MYVKYQMYHHQRVVLSIGPGFRFAQENPLCTHIWGSEVFQTLRKWRAEEIFQTLFCTGSIFWQAGKDKTTWFNNCCGLVLFRSIHSPSSLNPPRNMFKGHRPQPVHISTLFPRARVGTLRVFSLGGVKNHRAIYSSRRGNGQNNWGRHPIFKRRQKVSILLKYIICNTNP
jgi:hypothetical protein